MENSPQTSKKIGVAFTGSGLQGLANIALIELFEEVNFKPDFVVGCSGGAAIAGLWGQGLNAIEIQEKISHYLNRDIIRHVDLYGFLFFYKKPRNGYKKNHALLKANRLHKLYNHLFDDIKLENLQFPTAIQTTEVGNGVGAVFKQGLLKDIVYASSAMLPFIPPICIDNKWYADGSFTAPIPIMELVNRGMDHIISLSFTEPSLKKPKNFLSYYSNFVSQVFTKAQRSQITFAIEFHHGETLLLPVKPHMEGDIFDRREINRIMTAGRDTVQQYRDEILRLIER